MSLHVCNSQACSCWLWKYIQRIFLVFRLLLLYFSAGLKALFSEGLWLRLMTVLISCIVICETSYFWISLQKSHCYVFCKFHSPWLRDIALSRVGLPSSAWYYEIDFFFHLSVIFFSAISSLLFFIYSANDLKCLTHNVLLNFIWISWSSIILIRLTQDMANNFPPSNFYKSLASSSGHSCWTELQQWVSDKNIFSSSTPPNTPVFLYLIFFFFIFH